MTFKVTCPHCNEEFEVEAPVKEKKPRGKLAGIAIEDMTDEQLKREIINAGSVLYKAKQRGAAETVISANQARVDAAKAERDKRHPVVIAKAVSEDIYEDVESTEEIIDEATAGEI